MKKYLTVFLLCVSFAGILILEGCNGEGFSSAERIITSGWADVSNEDSEDQEPLYCYRTIGAVDCYKTPDPKRKKQLVSTYPAKNTARPIGVGKVITFLTQEEEDRAAIQERELDKVRYHSTASEKVSEYAQDQSWQATDAERQASKPLNIK